MKKLVKLLTACTSFGGKIVDLCSKSTDAMDHIIHYKEYQKAKKHAAVFRVMLCVAGGLLAVLFFPYKIAVEKNGDFEIKSLLVRVYRKTTPYEVPEGGDEDFDICGVEDETPCEVVGSAEAQEA